jgi:hypothetical protein
MKLRSLRRWFLRCLGYSNLTTRIADSQVPQTSLRRSVQGLNLEQLEDRIVPSFATTAPTWNEQGPFGGATEVLLTSPTVANEVFAGTVAGGVWRTTDITGGGNPANVKWTPISDQIESLHVGALAFDPNNSSTLYVGSGSFSDYAVDRSPDMSVGLFRTTNANAAAGSVTWEELGRSTFAGLSIRRIAVSTTSDQVFVAAADASGNGGLFVSVAGSNAEQWTKLTTGTLLPNAAVSDVLHDPNHSGTYYAAMPGHGIYRTDDSGATWHQIDNLGTAITGIGTAINIEMSAMNNGGLTVLDVGVIKSNGTLDNVYQYAEDGKDNNNNGAIDDYTETTWTAFDHTTPFVPPIEATGGGFYNFAIVADPVNANLVYVGGNAATDSVWIGDITAQKWTDLTNGGTAPAGGTRSLSFLKNNTTLLEGDNVGISQLPNAPTANKTWSSLAGNLRATELVDADYNTSSNLVFGAPTDQNIQVQTATGNPSWKFAAFGPGASVAYSIPGTIQYAMGPNFFLLTHNGAAMNLEAAVGGAVPFDGLENTSPGLSDRNYTTGATEVVEPGLLLEANRFTANSFMVGRRALYTSADQGNTISMPIGPTGLAGEKSPTERFMGQGVFGGKQNGTTFASIFWAGTELGHLYVRDSSNVIHDVTAKLNATLHQNGTAISSIVVDPDDYTRAWVLQNGHIAYTTNGGTSWTEITGNLGVLSPRIDTLAFVDPTPTGTAGDGTLVAGGQGGVFRYLSPVLAGGNPANTWSVYGVMPNTLVHTLVFLGIDPDGNSANGTGLLVAGTLGRGAWTLPNVTATISQPENLTVTGDANANSMDIHSDPANPYHFLFADGTGNVNTYAKGLFNLVQFKGLGGADTIRLDDNGAANAGGVVNYFNFNISVDGGGNVGDTLILEDISDPTSRQVTITPTTIGAGAGDNFFAPFVKLNYTGINTILLDMSAAAGPGDGIVLTGTAPGVAYIINGNGGNDTLFAPNTVNSWSITGPDSGVLNGVVVFNSVENLLGGSMSDAFFFGAGAGLSGALNGMGGINSITYLGAQDNGWFVTGPNAGSTTFLPGGFSSISYLNGGAGSDQFIFYPAGVLSGWVTGGGGINWLADASARNNIWSISTPNAGTVGFIGGGFTSIQNLFGSAGVDQFFFGPAGSLAGWVYGNGGSNYIADTSARNNSWLILGPDFGGVGFLGGGFVGVGNLYGSAGEDIFSFGPGGSESGWIVGGAGVNWLNYAAVTVPIDVDLNGDIASLTAGAVGFENVHGSAAGFNVLSGDNADNILVASGFGNSLYGWGGRDLLIGSSTLIVGGDGDDLLIGGSTVYDNDLMALQALEAEWTRTDIDYFTRVMDLRTGQGQALNRPLLAGQTVVFSVAGPGFGIGGHSGSASLFGQAGEDYFLSGLLTAIFDLDPATELVN